jgi:hypothetical protein
LRREEGIYESSKTLSQIQAAHRIISAFRSHEFNAHAREQMGLPACIAIKNAYQ